MDYEQKYKDALERAKKLQKTCDSTAVVGWCEYIFPELKESEDEKIKRELRNDLLLYVPTPERYIAWLEKQSDANKEYWRGYREGKKEILDKYSELKKQGEQKPYGHRKECEDCQFNYAGECKGYCALKRNEHKPTDEVKPKFKVGDWIILPLGIIARIDSINSTDYQVTTTDGKICDFKISKQDNYRLLTIQDAKDGDLIYVSTEEKGIQAIFHEYKNDTIFFHCYLCTDFVQGGYMPIGSVELTYPLQKTHYSRFFEKMHKAGYEWDGEKKELKKIESKMLDADKVIEWIHKYWPFSWGNFTLQVDDAIDKFKKDFGL